MSAGRGLVIDDLITQRLDRFTGRALVGVRTGGGRAVGNSTSLQQLLLFELAERRCALLARDVIEIVRAVAIRPLPHAPFVVEGIIDLRGEVVPVLDIRSRFRLPARPLRTSDHFVVVAAGARKVALRVDRAITLLELDTLPLAAAVHLPDGVRHLAGVTTLADELVLIHDLRSFLSEAEAIGLHEALDEVQASRGAA